VKDPIGVGQLDQFSHLVRIGHITLKQIHSFGITGGLKLGRAAENGVHASQIEPTLACKI
jgi:hypothetical protein